MLFTVTPSPFTTAARRFEKPAPGSKKPEPLITEPITVTFVVVPAVIDDGEQLTGVAGGGASSFRTRTPYESVASQNSWIVHMVMSSLGRGSWNDNCPHGDPPPPPASPIA